MDAPPYRLLDHTADLAFEVTAPDWPGLLAAATAALGDVILADDGRPVVERRPVRVSGADREDVLVAWLSEAAWLHEHEGFVARGARLDRADAGAAEGEVLGIVTDPSVEPPDRVVKAVTYHGLAVEAGVGGTPWRAVVVLDL